MYRFLKQKLDNLLSDKKIAEIITGSAWALGSRVGATVFVMCSSVIIARIYGAEMMGIVAMITSFLNLSMIFTVLGTNTSILRLIPEHMAKYSPTSAYRVYRKTQLFVLLFSLVTGFVLFLLSGMIAEKIFSKPYMAFLFAVASAFIVFLSLIELNTNAIRGLRLIRTFAFMQLLQAVSRLLILVFLTLFLFRPHNPVYAQFASYTLTGLISVLIMYIQFKKKMHSSDVICPMPIKNILSISLPMLMATTMAFAIGQTGVIILGVFRTETEVGYYDVAVKLATLTIFILNAVNAIAAPKFSELFHSGNMEDLFYVAQKSAKLIFWTTTPILVTLLLLGKPILKILFGQEFTNAYGAMVFLVIGQFINSISGCTNFFMNMTGNQKIFRNIILIASVVNIVICFILIPPYGIYGAAFSGMFSISLWNLGTIIYIKNKFGKVIGYLPFLPII